MWRVTAYQLEPDRRAGLTQRVLLLMLLWVGLAALVGYLGRQRTFGFWGYFFVSLLLSWAVGLLVVAFSKRRVPASPPSTG